MILTHRQDDLLLINYFSLVQPLIHFFLSYWEMDGRIQDLILINVVSNYK